MGRKGENTKMFEETFRDEGYVHYLHYSDGFIGEYVSQSLSKFTL